MRNRPTITSQAARGRQLAIELLEQLEDLGADECVFGDDEYRGGRPQSDALGVAWNAAKAAGPYAEREFCSVLTDFLGSALGGAIPDADFYRSGDVAA